MKNKHEEKAFDYFPDKHVNEEKNRYQFSFSIKRKLNFP